MGLIERVFGLVFGSGSASRNVITETVEVFRENAEKGAARDAAMQAYALQQYASEFRRPNKTFFDGLMDGLNRVPRPAMALGTLCLFVAAMIDPAWFASRMAGIALVPEPLWWLLGAIVSFYFGARHQLKGQEFQRSLAESLAQAPQVAASRAHVQTLNDPPFDADEAAEGSDAGNPALEDWSRRNS